MNYPNKVIIISLVLPIPKLCPEKFMKIDYEMISRI
jgi:hypothetical protein